MGRWGRRDAGREWEREMGFHLEELAQGYEEAGMDAKEARRRARIDFGAGDGVRQQLREVHSWPAWERAVGAGRAAWRFARRSPGLALAVVLTLALGTGANSAVFSALDGVLLRALPFPQGDRLVALGQRDVRSGEAQTAVAPRRLEDWNARNRTFVAVSGWYTGDVSEISGPLPERLEEALVAPRFEEVWGVRPAVGRGFTAEEQRFGGPAAVLISDGLWRRHFGAVPELAKLRVRVGKGSYAVVGVMPAGFAFPAKGVDLWAPSPVDAPYAQSRESTWFTTVGRLKPGVTLGQAREDLGRVQRELGGQYPKTDAELRVTVQTLKSVVVGEVGGSLWLLYAAVTLLLLVACGNMAALLLARAAEREQELAVRFALGASRGAVVGQLLSETLGLALVGGLLGLGVAYGVLRLLPAVAGELPRVGEVGLRPGVLLYTLGCTLAVALLCGLLPALRGARRELAQSLSLGGRTIGSRGIGSRTRVRARGGLPWVLVGGQVALAVMLLVGAGLLLRSFAELQGVRPGFDAGHVLVLRVSGDWGETADMGKLTQRVDRTLDALRAVPGVVAASTAAELPGAGGQVPGAWKVGAEAVTAGVRYVSAGYLSTMRIPLLRGVDCKAGERVQRLLVNESFAARYLASGEVLGRHLQAVGEHTFDEAGVVGGVVGDAREEGLAQPPGPTIYWCASAPDPFPYYLVRVQGDPAAAALGLRRSVAAVEPGRSVYGVAPLAELLGATQQETRLRTVLLALFAGIAVALAAVGLYGTLSAVGRTRRREVGLRLALGATRGQVAGAVLRQGCRVAAVGCGVGLGLGWAGSRLLVGLLYGVSASDPVTYVAVAAGVGLLAAGACAAPALRAARLDPARVLREQ